MRKRVLLGWVAVVALTWTAGLARAEVDKREMQGREAFAAGRYQEALDVFVKLYAEKLHPNYLRNIARCYQNLGEADKAISSFHEYLRKAKTMKAAERLEVEGYIQEMEALKRQREITAAPAPALDRVSTAASAPNSRSPTTPAIVNPPTIELGPAAGAQDPGAPSTPAGVSLRQSSDLSPAQARSNPVYTRWWFWTLIGGAVIGGVAVAGATGVFTKTQDAPCSGLCL